MAKTAKPIFSDHSYNVFKTAVLITLPALATLYFAIAQVWNLPKTDEIMATITAISAFLGTLLKISTTRYENSDAPYDGTIEVTEEADKKTFLLDYDGDPEELDRKSAVTFRIGRKPA